MAAGALNEHVFSDGLFDGDVSAVEPIGQELSRSDLLVQTSDDPRHEVFKRCVGVGIILAGCPRGAAGKGIERAPE